MMKEEKTFDQKPDPKRMAALRDLPKAVVESLTKEEVNTFLYEDDWPDSLQEKLKEYLVDEE